VQWLGCGNGLTGVSKLVWWGRLQGVALVGEYDSGSEQWVHQSITAGTRKVNGEGCELNSGVVSGCQAGPGVGGLVSAIEEMGWLACDVGKQAVAYAPYEQASATSCE